MFQIKGVGPHCICILCYVHSVQQKSSDFIISRLGLRKFQALDFCCTECTSVLCKHEFSIELKTFDLSFWSNWD
jgi:hypothetical protein